MTDRIPIKGVFDAGKSIGLAEFASGDTLGIALGGTGKTTAIEALAALGGQPNDNFIINGDFSVWQRGVTHSTTGYGSVDRWKSDFTGSGSALTVSKGVFTPSAGIEAMGNPCFYGSLTFTGPTSGYVRLIQPIENVQILSGNTVMVSGWFHSVAATEIAIELEQLFGSGGSSPVSNITPQKLSIGPGWVYRSASFSLPSSEGKTIPSTFNSYTPVSIWLSADSSLNSRTGSLGVKSGTVSVTGLKVEGGSLATPFRRRSYAEELLSCQRYYQTLTANFGAYMIANDSVFVPLPFQQVMRVVPTVTFTGYTFSHTGASIAATAATTQSITLQLSSGPNGPPTYAARVYAISGTIAFDGEL